MEPERTDVDALPIATSFLRQGPQRQQGVHGLGCCDPDRLTPSGQPTPGFPNGPARVAEVHRFALGRQQVGESNLVTGPDRSGAPDDEGRRVQVLRITLVRTHKAHDVIAPQTVRGTRNRDVANVLLPR